MQHIRQLAISARVALMLVLLLQGAFCFADDTEIFLSRGKADIKPNVFFILDDSLSMQWCWNKDGVYPDSKSKRNRCPDGTFTSRWDELQKTLNNVLPKMQDVNFGMMWMDYRRSGIPVDAIDKVRDQALASINKRPKPDLLWTPIDGSLYKAARYFNGFPAKQYRDHYFKGHSGKEALRLGKDFPSPITDACQPNYIVLVTDGDAWYDDIYPDIRELIGRKRDNWPKQNYPCVEQPGASSKNAERCVPELAEWLHTHDQMPNLEGDQTVTTHVISLAPDLNAPGATKDADNIEKIVKRRQFLNNVTDAGGGNYYEANNGEELSKQFNDIIEKAAKVENATFVNPSAAPTSSKRTTDQVYYALFQPGGSDRWAGNLKRYRFAAKAVTKNGKTSKEAVIYDVNDNPAIDADGAFKANAQSFWSKGADGGNITLGGAAWKLPEPAKRRLFVETEGRLGELAISNSAITNDLLGAVDNNERVALLNYIRGLDDDGLNERSKELGDFLHSAAVPFNYGSAESDQVVIIGSNEGFVHLFNRKTGVEEFAFMPGELLKNIKPIKANEPSTANKPHPYGVDNSVTVWLDDSNQNGQFDAGEHFYAYVTLRRGGQGIYALDITKRGQPKLLWQIDEKNKKAKGFARLGQSWSQPVKSKIKIGNNPKPTDVLIFAGGYDPTEDNLNGANDAYRSDSALGNAIYIVDAKTGNALWSASQSGAVLNLPDMQYSIPSSVKVVDIDNDGLADQMFVGDTGGQVWRLFIHNGESRNNLVTASGRRSNAPFAQLGKNNPKNARRFYQEPDVALDRGNNRLLVNIGSGYRAHPLNSNVDDRFYSLHADITRSPDLPLTESDLHQATRSFDHFDQEKAIKAINTAKGWYLPLEIGRGEKVLSTASSAGGDVFFATYVPANNRIGCQVMLGSNYVYRLSLSSASPPVEIINPPANGIAGKATVTYQPPFQKSDVVGIISGGGIFSDEKNRGTFMCFGDTCSELNISPCENPRGCKTYWIDLQN
ncbi:hypothetical protein AXE65_10195 [Ventosimonas gracilis]|uniref:PilY1 beta-propeller domain-containing protein n=1 Tax=Ventosimonas gracilis TaxID=1680762 RepID=A0A139SX10_9GAMM|nr:PilC/PilY family type IV pilus protein [Ventosimonas gracilis]KXU39138.1 hypothetical protein AXE65_10195 [Ventosimonas gracilis]